MCCACGSVMWPVLPDTQPCVVAIVGPTAAGKSALALSLAEHLDAEIVCADSRQVFRYMDIGTAKPSRQEQSRIPHYMLDLVEPDARYSVQEFAAEGGRVLRRLWARGRPVLVVGGTGFYLRGLLDGLYVPAVPPDPPLRAALRGMVEEHGPEALHARLAAVDPVSARRIHPHNVPRVVRALEIVQHLGGPVPPLRTGATVQALRIGVTQPRDMLTRAIDRRAEAQVRAGLVEETRLLLAMGYDPALASLQGFGYRQMVEYLQGHVSLADALERYQAATRQYARRQMTWFRADQRIHWLEYGPHMLRAALALISQNDAVFPVIDGTRATIAEAGVQVQ